MQEPPFVGDDRVALVEWIEDLFGRGSSYWVSLEAPSGWGKTRLIHEFYKLLVAQHQADGRYWPPSIRMLRAMTSDSWPTVPRCAKWIYPRSST